ncbi:hypothetical protein [Lutibacter maritimus]|uniref:Chromosome partitioning protein ParA n=1 Tax=Lutibacter maritimus TaxID=593133 RepID=A0A1I6Q9N7_9FLAO|nr:hypothetical protein [Lutibacter maritimus]SFS49166.1 hypothetical protein SAMN04488006_1661 [Lutibacter maritimus]
MEDSKNSNNKFLIIALALLLVGISIYTFYSSTKLNKLNDAIEVEKNEIASNLDSMIVKYEDAISKNTSMSNELSLERDRIIMLRDSVKNMKVINYEMLRKFRSQIFKLEETNKQLFQKNEILISENRVLSSNLDSVKVVVSNQLAKNDTLTVLNQGLSEKVKIGSILKVNSAKILAMRERSGGKLVETSRSRNTDAFRVNFTIAKNEISEPGERNVYIQIVDLKGSTIARKGQLVLFDNTSIDYSDKTIVNYVNEPIDIISLVEVNRDNIKDGVYTVNIFIENKFAGASQITLK